MVCKYEVLKQITFWEENRFIFFALLSHIETIIIWINNISHRTLQNSNAAIPRTTFFVIFSTLFASLETKLKIYWSTKTCNTLKIQRNIFKRTISHLIFSHQAGPRDIPIAIIEVPDEPDTRTFKVLIPDFSCHRPVD